MPLDSKLLKLGCLHVRIKCGIAEYVSRKDHTDDGRTGFFQHVTI